MSILDAFFDQMYAGLVRAGVAESDMPHVEGCIKERFKEYERAQLYSSAGPMSGLGMSVAKLMFDDGGEALRFASLPVLRRADAEELVKKLFDEHKIAK